MKTLFCVIIMFIGKLKTLVCKDLFKLDVVMRKGGADIALPKFVK